MKGAVRRDQSQIPGKIGGKHIVANTHPDNTDSHLGING